MARTRTILTEKRQVAQGIGRVLGASTDRGDYLEGNGYIITWCQGHLLELYVREATGSWSLDRLPILPDTFALVPAKRTERGSGKKTDAASRSRLAAIARCFDMADDIVCATDAGREGQLIFDEVNRYLNNRKKVYRLWISTLEDDDIRSGFQNLYDNDSPQFANLTVAARLRSEADWLVGINATRAFTLASGVHSQVLSVGRVITPTLGLICRRYITNRLFKPEPFWYIAGKSTVDGITFPWRSSENYKGKETGDTDLAPVLSDRTVTVSSIKTERGTDTAPLLHDITSLQQVANSRYGLTPDETLDAAQALYEKRLISYPRTGTRYIPEVVFERVPSILTRLFSHPEYGWAARRCLDEPRLPRKCVNDSKITDHYALIVTGREAGNLEGAEAQVYELILSRFIEAFSAPCVYDATTVELRSSAGTLFRTRGRKDISQGWKAVCKGLPSEDTDLRDVDEVEMSISPFPALTERQVIPVDVAELVEDTTKPPRLLTDATLLNKMKTAGKDTSDRKLAAALKDIGIGTPATRSEIIKNLVTLSYVERKKRFLVPTELGLDVFRALSKLEVSSVDMTARWEIALDDIAEGTGDAEKFRLGIRDYTVKVTGQLMEENNVSVIREKMAAMIPKCPRCGKEMRLTEKSAWCQGCGLNIWRAVIGKRLTDEQLRSIVNRGRTGLLHGFVKKDGTKIEDGARLVLQQDFTVKPEWERKKYG